MSQFSCIRRLLCIYAGLFLVWQWAWAEPIVLTNLPSGGKAASSRAEAGKKIKPPKQGKEQRAAASQSGTLSLTDPKVITASQRMDEWLTTRRSDPFFQTHAAILKKMGPQLIRSGIPPEYWPEAVAFAYSSLSVQTQQLMKALQQMETLERARYDQEMALHSQKPRLIPRPVLNLEPLYVLRRQLLEISALE